MRICWVVVCCYHFILWSSYSIVGWLSNKDSLISKVILLFIFFYLAYLIAYTLLKTRRVAIIISFASLMIYLLGNQLYLALLNF